MKYFKVLGEKLIIGSVPGASGRAIIAANAVVTEDVPVSPVATLLACSTSVSMTS